MKGRKVICTLIPRKVLLGTQEIHGDSFFMSHTVSYRQEEAVHAGWASMEEGSGSTLNISVDKFKKIVATPQFAI